MGHGFDIKERYCYNHNHPKETIQYYLISQTPLYVDTS